MRIPSPYGLASKSSTLRMDCKLRIKRGPHICLSQGWDKKKKDQERRKMVETCTHDMTIVSMCRWGGSAKLLTMSGAEIPLIQGAKGTQHYYHSHLNKVISFSASARGDQIYWRACVCVCGGRWSGNGVGKGGRRFGVEGYVGLVLLNHSVDISILWYC